MVSEMDDILRRLYSGQYFPGNYTDYESDEVSEDKKMMDENHQIVMNVLKEKYGEEKAFQIDNDFIGAYTSVVNEEMLNIFKEGFYLGFEIAMTAITKKNLY